MKYEGTIEWNGWDPEPIEDAVITADRIAFDVTTADYNYSVVLRPAAPPSSGDVSRGRWFQGRWSDKRYPDAGGRVTAKLVVMENGGIFHPEHGGVRVLDGEWFEPGERYTWSAEFERAET